MRRFLLSGFLLIVIAGIDSCIGKKEPAAVNGHEFNGPYTGEYLNRIAYPLGGMGAGMFCIEGTGALSHMSVRNRPDVFNAPCMFAAISVKGVENGTLVAEGEVPEWKKFGSPGTGNGSGGTSYGLPRFEKASFLARFPYAEIDLADPDVPLDVSIKAWSPFIPADADNSSLPVAALEYSFRNTSNKSLDAVFSYNTVNFMAVSGGRAVIRPLAGGFILTEKGVNGKPATRGDFAIFTNEPGTIIDHCWFRGGWWDPLTITWATILKSETRNTPPVEGPSPGASLYIPFSVGAGETKMIRLMLAWYVPETDLKYGQDPEKPDSKTCTDPTCSCKDPFYKPWYSGKFGSIEDVVSYWKTNYDDLNRKSTLFSEAFYSNTLPPEVTEAVAANLTILKSPTVLRQTDGKLWNWEGCGDNVGCCAGSCTHVWNYAQAIPHLFPALERTLRETEFFQSQDAGGHQTFRSALPIRPVASDFYAAADGQLGGIIKVYRDWRISGNTQWLEKIYPRVQQSMDYCIKTWDPRLTGTLEEPHHNTYDIEFWGPDGMCTSFYLGALKAMAEMGRQLGKDISSYVALYEKGRKTIENDLYNGEYFIQKIRWQGLDSPDPVKASEGSWNSDYSDEAKVLLQKEGPKYQYGSGCLSDGILGVWIGEVCGLKDIVDSSKVKSHLNSVYKYNFRRDLSNHSNPQRPSYALGNEGGLLICTWPKGGMLSLPFVYSNEVWTGIEYQVASHLMMAGEAEKGLDIVRTARKRYDGRIRNPFDEYECGHWYARALSSYALLQGLTGARYDALTRTMFIDSRAGDFRSFISTETGFGNVGLKNGKPFLEVAFGEITVRDFKVN
ncbi:MAG TPA: GH116 family glycosyl hydrolase [Bacteroidales bacterium]|nr:GH116 family glycosyl hydrolase [Bacteroidales bacterium]